MFSRVAKSARDRLGQLFPVIVHDRQLKLAGWRVETGRTRIMEPNLDTTAGKIRRATCSASDQRHLSRLGLAAACLAAACLAAARLTAAHLAATADDLSPATCAVAQVSDRTHADNGFSGLYHRCSRLGSRQLCAWMKTAESPFCEMTTFAVMCGSNH